MLNFRVLGGDRALRYIGANINEENLQYYLPLGFQPAAPLHFSLTCPGAGLNAQSTILDVSEIGVITGVRFILLTRGEPYGTPGRNGAQLTITIQTDGYPTPTTFAVWVSDNSVKGSFHVDWTGQGTDSLKNGAAGTKIGETVDDFVGASIAAPYAAACKITTNFTQFNTGVALATAPVVGIDVYRVVKI